MRHFLSYDSSGNLVGVHTHKQARTGLGGWPGDFDLHNGREAINEHARAWADRVLTQFADRMVGFVAFDCNCPPTHPGGACRCASNKRLTHMMNADRTAMVAKPASAVLIDGGLWGGEDIIRAPGAAITLKITCADAEDGATVDVSQSLSPRLWLGDAKIQLTFASGETAEHTMYAPAHGLTGSFGIFGPCIQHYAGKVIGWTA